MPTPTSGPADTTIEQRWSLRRTKVAISTLAVATALWLGLTAPTVSPVTPVAAPPPAVTSVTTATTATTATTSATP